MGNAYARQGRRDKERTIEALDGMTLLGAQRLGLYLQYPEMALLKGDPRVHELRKKAGLPL